MDVNRLSQGEKIAAGSAIVLFIVMFFSWFGAPEVAEEVLGAAGVDTPSANAWESFDFIDLILLLTIIVAVGAAALKASGNALTLPVPASTVTALLGALSTLLVLYRIIDPPADASRKFGVFLGLIFAAAIAYGGWRAMEEEGTSFQDAADRLSSDRDRDREQRARDRGAPGAAAPPPAEPPPPGEPPSRSEPPPPPPPPPPPAGRP
jgi:hypothetical protein